MTTCRKIVNWRTYLRFPPEVGVWRLLALALPLTLSCNVKHVAAVLRLL